MKRRVLGRTGLEVSEIGFGALEIGRDWAGDVNPDPAHPSEDDAGRVLNGLLDRGVNFIDTAPAYWSSEEFIGKAIAHRRSEYVLATKVGEHCDRNGSFYDYSAAAVHRFVDQSLRRLKTDHIDLLQIHSASMEVLERGETLAAMQEARQAGKARFLGMTGGVNECVRAVELGGYDTVQFPYNLLNRSAEERLLALAKEKNVGTIVMRPLAGGKLTWKYERLADAALRDQIGAIQAATGLPAEKFADVALQYLLARPEITTLIAGSRRLDAVRANIAAAAGRLAPAQILAIREAAARVTAKAW